MKWPFIWSLSLSPISNTENGTARFRPFHRGREAEDGRKFDAFPLLLYIYNLLIKSNDKKRKCESRGGMGGGGQLVCVYMFFCLLVSFRPF